MNKAIFVHKKRLCVLSCLPLFIGCAIVDTVKIPTEVPEIHPGILAGYLDTETLPNSLELIPPPPEESSAAMALDEEVSRKALTLRDTPRWNLAIEDANLDFPEALGTFFPAHWVFRLL